MKYFDSPQSTNFSLLAGCLEFLKLELDISFDPLCASASQLTYCTPTWWTLLITFMRKAHWEIIHKFLWFCPTQASNVYLMEAFHRHSLTPHTHCQLNECRLLLHIITLGNLLNAGGTIILTDMRLGRLPSCLHRLYTWLNCAQTPPFFWKVWQNTLRDVFIHRATGFRISTPVSSPLRWPLQWFSISPLACSTTNKKRRFFDILHHSWPAVPTASAPIYWYMAQPIGPHPGSLLQNHWQPNNGEKVVRTSLRENLKICLGTLDTAQHMVW